MTIYPSIFLSVYLVLLLPVYTFVSMVTRPPRKVNGPDISRAPPPCRVGCRVPVPSVGWLWGFGFRVCGRFAVKKKPSSRQGLREDFGCRFVRVDGVCSACFFLEPALRRGLGLGVGKNRSTRYIVGFACDPWPPPSTTPPFSGNGPDPSSHMPAPPPPDA